MIRIDKIRIHRFRGIIDLELEPKGANFAACGPNGTGKSGIVDAIEFGLTGKLSRLSGYGTGDLSVAKHGPHVDFRGKPDEAFVEIDLVIPSLGKAAKIVRTVKAAAAPTITPADPDILTILEEVALHPEFVLSRRELIDYIIAKPGDRAEEVQALLRLGQVDKLRELLNKIANACKKEATTAAATEKDVVAPLLTALGIETLSKALVLAAVNPKREILGLQPLTELAADTSLAEGVEKGPGDGVLMRVPKVQAGADVKALKSALAVLTNPAFKDLCATLSTVASTLAADPASAEGVKRETLLNAALNLYDSEQCPVCDTPFAPDEFVAHLKEKLEHLSDVAARRQDIEKKLEPVLEAIQAAGTALAAVIAHGPNFEPKQEMGALVGAKQTLLGRFQQIKKLLPLEDTAAVLAAGFELSEIQSGISVVDAAIAALPEPDTQVAARDFLLLAQERLERYREARQKHVAAQKRAELSAQVYKVYGDTTTAALEGIYTQVQDTFAELYREINREDEGSFTAKLTPSIGKLGFDVDFYGRGPFPPGAYHSEGHQDGMGVCLYLALMNHLLGNSFTLAVFDDVLMSVDTGHRREVCALLQKHFPETQFILTTHDDVWLQHMRTEGLIKGKGFAHFKNWSVETGPKVWSGADIWEEIDGHLALDEVAVAGGKLRRYLEYFAGEMCDRLRGTVQYRADGRFELSDLLNGAASATMDAFKAANKSANSWGKAELVEHIGARKAAFAAAREETKFDQWQVNAAVHYNAWANLKKEDFQPVVAAFRKFTEQFYCDNCKEPLAILPKFHDKQALKCACDKSSLNLVAKAGGGANESQPKAEAATFTP
ncbi:ATP-binding protein [Phenylobacterium sp.]|uniref:ATP-binding protein n=1 Tax=Phenylobacterium sp. TaxID=1871053 RepID=UPI003003055A